MKTWSAEECAVKVLSAAAGGVQGLIGLASGVERITRPPRMGHDVDVPLGLDYTRELCPANCDCGGCYHNPERNCHCFDGADQLAEREAEQQVWEPSEIKYGPCPKCGAPHVVGKPCTTCLLGLLQKRYDDQVFRAGNHTGAGAEPNSPVAGARAAGSSPSEVSGAIPPASPSEGCPDPSREHRLASVSGEGSPADSGTTRPPAGDRPDCGAEYVWRDTAYRCTRQAAHFGQHGEGGVFWDERERADLTWRGWAMPAILTVLADHQLTWHVQRIECWDDNGGSCCRWFADMDEWREHVAELIADRIVCDPTRAMAALRNTGGMETGQDMGATFASEFYPQHKSKGPQ